MLHTRKICLKIKTNILRCCLACLLPLHVWKTRKYLWLETNHKVFLFMAMVETSTYFLFSGDDKEDTKPSTTEDIKKDSGISQ